MARYILTLESMHINSCRSHTDTDTAIFALSQDGGSPQYLQRDLGDVHQGLDYSIGLAFPSFTASDATQIRHGYAIINDGATRGNANNEAQLINGTKAQLAAGMLDAKFGSSRSGLAADDGTDYSDEMPPTGGYPVGMNPDPALNSVIDWSAVWTIIKPLIMGAAEAFFKWIEGIFNPNCDGFVAAEMFSVSGQEFRTTTYRNNPYRVTKRYPGYDSATGCGSNSDYTVTWSVIRQDITLDPSTLNVPADVLIVNKNSGLALDVPGASVAPHARIQQYAIHGRANQQMRLTPSGGPGANTVFTISPRNSQLNLDVIGGNLSPHAQIQQYDPHSDYHDQQWVFNPAGDGSYFIHSATTPNLVLDVPDASMNSGVAIQLYPRKQTGADNQQWWLRPL